MTASTVDIVGLGVIAIDDVLCVDRYPPPNSKVRVHQRRRHTGGMTACALATAARLGSRCTILGRLGEDLNSDFACQELAAVGVDLSRLVFEAGAGPLESVIVVADDSASRSIFADRTRVRPLLPAELDPTWFHNAKVLHIDHLEPATALAAARLARESGLQVVSDLERISLELPELREVIDHFICGREFACTYTGCSDPAESCAVLARTASHACVVVTAGETGCYWQAGPEAALRHLPAHTVPIVDTTGCGDVFHGAYCHGLVAGWSIEQIVRFANAAAALKATRPGGWHLLPGHEEIERLLAGET